ncbi:MAG: prephenate dehydrogenase/arogenate dehydrogenase family protein [Candidatus Omnitrophica bacterium]|nr:prephenate dehydrogenase/arogenate dehydrogenase family protein [Candidatus Omnitrophota bacterium]
MKFNRITIIGVGLIGGSIGLAVKKRRIAKEVVGVFRRNSTMKKALTKRAVDRATMNIREGVKGADIIIIASPVYSIPSLVHEAMRYAKEGAIITDVGSTKSWIMEEAARLKKPKNSISFVGSHPMAGSEHAGVEFAKYDLLEGSPCIVIKSKDTGGKALSKISGFWKSLGARVSVMTSREHDRAIALVSHLPHVVAFSLVSSVPLNILKYAAEGFKDTTRVASSDPKLWADIFLSNRKEVLKSARAFEASYKALVKALSAGSYRGVAKILGRAKRKRDKFIYGKAA